MSDRREDPRPGREDPAMADILASIRRIVNEPEPPRREPAAPGDVLVLTDDMRVDKPAPSPQEAVAERPLEPATEVEAPEPLSLDEAQIADVARAVLREELKGDLGKLVTRNLRQVVREEVARALAEREQGGA